MGYQKKLFWLIAISSLVKLIVASSVELGNVEAYYWVLATKLQWNYFDHPPMVAWLIRLTTANLLLHSEVFVRLGAIIASAACTWLMFKIGKLIGNEETGWYAALLYATSIYAGIGAGAFILPDSPQMFFWLWALLVFLTIIRSDAGDSKQRWLWGLFGIAAGLCIMSKVHGVFLWFGAALYLLAFDRARLKNPFVYLAIAITLVIISPILIWNLQHDFITYKFQSGRVNLAGAGIQLWRFMKILVQVIFAVGPIHFVLICGGIYWFFRKKPAVDKKSIYAVLLFSLPLVLILLFISLFRETLPHWPGPALSTLLILPAARLASKDRARTGRLPIVAELAIGYAIIVAAAQILTVNFIPGTTSGERQGMRFGADDATLDMYGWKTAGTKFDSLYKSDVLTHKMPANAPIIITNWHIAAHIDFYMTGQNGPQTYGIGDIYDLHQYYWWNALKKPLKAGDDAYYIVPSNDFDYKTYDALISRFRDYNAGLIFNEYRAGELCRQFYIFRFRGYKGKK